MKLVSSANNTGTDTKFILRGRPIIYIMNYKGPRIYFWGTPSFNVPHFELN
jgi:hypothetical protein